MMRRTPGLMAIAILIFSTACTADVTDKWKTECIGRYQVSAPGEVEIALSSAKHFFDENSWDRDKFRFADDTIAYFSSGYDVYPKMDTKESLEFITAFKNGFDKTETSFDTKIAYWMYFKDDVNKRDYAWVQPGFYSLFIFRDGHYFNFGNNFSKSTNPTKDTEKSVAEVNANIKTFHPRALYEQPKQPGVCIPYGFIADNGAVPHDVAVTMRLLDHPDIEVALRDSTYTENNYRDGKSIQAYPDPKEAINYLFANSGITNADEKEEVNFPGYHTVEMDGRKGGAVFITITRKDGSKDYGYVAAVQGTADTPGLLLYVIRTASRAKGKPVSKGELKDMAEKIVASVKRHAVQ